MKLGQSYALRQSPNADIQYSILLLPACVCVLREADC